MSEGNGQATKAVHVALPEITVKEDGDWEVSMPMNGGRVTLYPDGIYLEVGRRYEYWPLSGMATYVQQTGQQVVG